MACKSCKRRKRIGSTGGGKYDAILFGALGAMASKALNSGIQNIYKNETDEKKRTLIKGVVGVGKGIIGGILYFQKDRMLSDLGVGFAAAGLLETAEAAAPDVFKSLAGMDYVAGYGHDGGMYQVIRGTSNYRRLSAGAKMITDPAEESHGVYGPRKATAGDF
jgi:hypothetical protein